MEVQFPRGVRDLLPNEALIKNELVKKIELVYQKFGFLIINTPSFESLEVLKAKNAIGEENKLIYELKDENIGLRYDHTISLARYYAMHQELPLPFKRYYIGNVWRRDEPQKNRYREFTQADIDILGGSSIYTDVEVMATAMKALEEIGIRYKLRINDRRFVDAILDKIGVGKDLHHSIFRIMDKLDKIGTEGVVKQLSDFGIRQDAIEQLIHIISFEGKNDEKLRILNSILGEGNKLISDFKKMLDILALYKLNCQIEVDFSLVRGIDYYTSTIFEFAGEGIKSSIGSGGRYDNLIGIFSGKNITAVGASLGIDRILDLLDFSSSLQYTYSKVIINYIKENNFNYALEVANILRDNGINTEINLAQRNIANQLAHANALNIIFAIIIGDSEEKTKMVKIRNLIDGKEELMKIEEAIYKLKQ